MPRGVRGRQVEVKGGERRREVREGEKGEKQEGERGRPLEQSQSQTQPRVQHISCRKRGTYHLRRVTANLFIVEHDLLASSVCA